MKFDEIVNARYATKKFDGKVVPEATMEKLYDLIRLSASSFNLQPWKIKVITDKKTKEKLQTASWNQEQITSCSHLLVLCADKEVGKLIDKLEKQMLKAGVPAENLKQYVSMMRGMNSSMSEEQRLSWAQKQVYIALGNAMNGAKSLGLDSCPMEGFDAKQYAQILMLPTNLVPTLVCPIGYAADKPRPKMRFTKEEVFF